MSRNRLILLGAFSLLAIIAIVSAASAGGDKKWLRVEHRDLVLGIPVEGELEAEDSALLGPPAIDRIWNFQISMIAPEGAEVVAGQPVLGFDTTELRRRLGHARAEIDSAQKTLEKSEIDLDIEKKRLELSLEEAQARLRKAELKTGGSEELSARNELRKARIDHDLAQLEIDNVELSLEQFGIKTRMQVANLRSKVELAKAEVAHLEESIERMTVKAPRAGTVIMKTDWRQQKKQVGDQVWRANPVLEIPDLSAMKASAKVDEALAGRLELGQSVVFRLDAYPDFEYRARVAQIRRAVQSKSPENPAKVVKLTLELEKTDTERMRPGMRFRGTIAAETVPGLLMVPAEAVLSDRDGAFVYEKTLFGERKVYPEFGRRNGEWVEITSGLSAAGRVLAQSRQAASE